MAQNIENINYQPMSLERHNPGDVANLIYESAPELFAIMFGPCTIAYLTKLIQRSHNRYSHQYIHVAAIAQRVVGIAVLVPTANINETGDYRDIFNVVQRLWLKLLQRFVLRHVLEYEYPTGSLYIGNLAVVAEYRSQGIGRQLLSQCIETATSASCPLFISVDVSNTRAQKLYESLGFRLFETKVLRVLWVKIGVCILSR